MKKVFLLFILLAFFGCAGQSTQESGPSWNILDSCIPVNTTSGEINSKAFNDSLYGCYRVVSLFNSYVKALPRAGYISKVERMKTLRDLQKVNDALDNARLYVGSRDEEAQSQSLEVLFFARNRLKEISKKLPAIKLD